MKRSCLFLNGSPVFSVDDCTQWSMDFASRIRFNDTAAGICWGLDWTVLCCVFDLCFANKYFCDGFVIFTGPGWSACFVEILKSAYRVHYCFRLRWACGFCYCGYGFLVVVICVSILRLWSLFILYPYSKFLHLKYT